MRTKQRASHPIAVLLGIAVLGVLPGIGCRDRRTLHPGPAAARRPQPVHVSTLVPGGKLPAPWAANGYEESPYAVSQGQQLFDFYNCSGCHAHGGGGMGPALMDDQWIYGSEPANLYDTISEGRPNGMPAYGTRIPSGQIWQLAAYVRSLASLTPRAVTPARSDHLQAWTGFTPSPQTPRSEPAEHSQ
jgi:cytochrome c oxidase cbb3-type subunit 3